jgi:hypothetical protein
VKLSVYNHLNNDIGKEVKSLNEIEIKQCYFPYSLKEWKEREHNTVDVNPVLFNFR